jgi:sec-independent protein translocase protein TatA
MMDTLIAVPGGWELVLIVLVILLLFGAKKLPELARGSGRALRIFKAETKGLVDDEDDVSDSQKTTEEKEIETRRDQSEPVIHDQTDPVVREQRDGTTG